MSEWVLIVWLVLSPEGQMPVLAPAFEVGTFRQPARCEASAATISFERPDTEFIALCVERDK